MPDIYKLIINNVFGESMKNAKNILRDEKGAVTIIEAALVFPIAVFVIILCIYMGNMIYQQSKMDAIAVRGAEYLASIYTNPMLTENGIPTDSTKVNIKPYRYLFGDSAAEQKTKNYIEGLIASVDSGFFSGMDINGSVKECKINNYVVYQTASVEIEYSINLLPMKLFGNSPLFRCSNATVTAATDSAEFIRNIDMILDYSEQFGLTEKIKQFVGKFTGN